MDSLAIVWNGCEESDAATDAALQKENGSITTEVETTGGQEGEKDGGMEEYEWEFEGDVVWQAGKAKEEWEYDERMSVIGSNEEGWFEKEAEMEMEMEMG